MALQYISIKVPLLSRKVFPASNVPSPRTPDSSCQPERSACESDDASDERKNKETYCMSRCIIVTRLACSAHKFASSNRWTRYLNWGWHGESGEKTYRSAEEHARTLRLPLVTPRVRNSANADRHRHLDPQIPLQSLEPGEVCRSESNK
jgi:hypothetical protein